MGQVGYTWAEDGGMWAGKVGRDSKVEEEVKEVKEVNHFPPAKVQAKAPKPRKYPDCLFSRMTHRMEPSPAQKRNSPPKPPPPRLQRPHAPPRRPPQRGGGRAEGPIVDTKVHVLS